nr:crossover junction endonuclease MUS81-like isoform X2 [Procambarus clarkii]
MNRDGRVNKRKKYRRTKCIVSHPNALFDKWLQEWQEAAARSNSNMKFNFQRARKSLRLFPLPLYSGKDCKVLANFGDKICHMLDQRLEQHVQENGPVEWDQIHKIRMEPPEKRKKKTTVQVYTAAATEMSVDASVTSSVICKENNDGKRSKDYIPALRSGAYALLLALYNASDKDNFQGFLKKAELMEAAQPLCDASFLHASEGSRYTAWSSMSTLIKKELAKREGNPSRYSITHKGKTLAVRLMMAESINDCNSSSLSSLSCNNINDSRVVDSRTSSCMRLSNRRVDYHEGMANPADNNRNAELTSTLVSNSRIRRESLNGDISSNKVTTCASFVTTTNLQQDGLQFSYVTSLGVETPEKDRAVVAVEEDGFLGFLMKCSLSDLVNSDLCYRLDKSSNCISRSAPPGFTYAYLSNDCAPALSPGLRSLSLSSPVTYNKHVSVRRQAFGTSFAPSSDKNIHRELVDGSVPVFERGLNSEILPSLSRQNLAHFPQFTFLSGEYEILLCIDNAEITGGFTGGNRSTKEIIINELDKHGIKYSVRKLHVGDFLWVCRERFPSSSGHKEQPRELVLPYIIERKRMDDLASSIKDGRFREQKFRLKKCGLSKPMYLVEKYGSQNLSLPESTCLQAVVNTQIVDGFTVKVTKDQRESAAFLTIMTRCLQSKYQGKAVSGVVQKDVYGEREETHGEQKTETLLMTFTEFNAASVKNRQLSVKEMFAKHLLQIHGLSVDKARAVVDEHGAPALLMSAYEKLTTPGAAEQMLAPVKCGKAGRSLGPTLSTVIAKLYTTHNLQ